MLTIEAKKVADLKPYPRNPRIIDEASLRGLKNSIKRFGLLEPLIVNKKNEVVSGNQRLKVVRQLGYEEVPTITVDLPSHEELALNAVLNNPHTQGQYSAAIRDIIEEIRRVDLSLPDMLRLDEIEGVVEEFDLPPLENEGPIPEMELQPYEHYDYVVVVCRDTHSWKTLCEKLGIVDVRYKKAIGLGRAITYEHLAGKVGWL